MSYAAPFNLVSFHAPGHTDPVAARLTWPLVGSLAIHAIVFIALVSLRFAPLPEESAGSYMVALVTLPETPVAPPVSPAPVPAPAQPAQPVETVPPPPKIEAKEAPQPVSPAPAPAPAQPAQPVETIPPPPKIEAKEAPQPVSPAPAPAPAQPAQPVETIPPPPKIEAEAVPQPVSPAPRPAPAQPEQSVETAPPPPKMAAEEVPQPERVTDSLLDALDAVGVPQPRTIAELVPSQPAESTRSAPVPRVAPLARTLKQAVGTIVVPKKHKPSARRIPVSPTAKPDRKRKQDPVETPEVSDIVLPGRAPRLETTVPLDEGRDRPIVVPPAPALARLPSEQDPAITSLTASRPESSASPEFPEFPESSESPESDDHVADLQTASRAQDMPPELQVAGSSSRENVYWGRVKSLIAGRWIVYRVDFRRRKPLQVVVAFRVERNGRTTGLRVVRSSGNTHFDSAATRAVVAATPLPPFPEQMPNPFRDVQYTFTGPPNR